MLPVEYFHVVFTLPAEITRIALWNKPVVYRLLFRASAETVMIIAADHKRLGSRVGMTYALHTWESAPRTPSPYVLVFVGVFDIQITGFDSRGDRHKGGCMDVAVIVFPTLYLDNFRSQDVDRKNGYCQIQDQDDTECLIALPSRFGTDGIGLSVIGSDDVAMIDYLETVLTDTSDSITQARILVGSPQCPALDFISANRDYPATRIGLRLEKTQIRSGGRLLGLLQLPTASSDVLLLLIDNNGVVQDLVDFTQTKDTILRFEVPMTRVGPLRDTRQLLLAVASQKPLDDLRRRNGQLAQDVFGDLPADLARNAALAVIGFEVR